MNLNSKYFKYLFRTETVIGMNTLSVDGLDQKLRKTVYTCFIMTCTIIGLVHSLAYEHPNIGLTFYVVRTTHAFITAVHDYRTKVTAILNLEAIERRLSTEKSGGPDTTLADTGVSLLSQALYVVHWTETVTELMTGLRSILYTQTIHQFPFQLVQVLSVLRVSALYNQVLQSPNENQQTT